MTREGDPITLRYEWRKNGVQIAGQTASTLDLSLAGNGDKGDAISVRVAAFDGISEGAPRTSAQVSIENTAPVFGANLPNRTDFEGAAVSVSAGATDADGDPLTYEATGLPAGITLNATNGLLSGTIATGAASASPYNVSISVREGAVADAVDSFTWTVTVPPVLPVLSPGGAAVAEGNSGTTTVNVPIALSAPASTTVTVDYATVDGSARAPSDYTTTSGTLTFVPGDTLETVPVAVKGDSEHEPQELFLVSLSNANGATIGGFYGLAFVFVNNDDPPPVIKGGIGSVVEGDTGTVALQIPVRLSAPSGATVTVNWTTVPSTGLVPGQDYVSASGTLTFAPGDTEEFVSITVLGDDIDEPGVLFGAEWLFIGLSSPTNAVFGTDFFANYAHGFITDDD